LHHKGIKILICIIIKIYIIIKGFFNLRKDIINIRLIHRSLEKQNNIVFIPDNNQQIIICSNCFKFLNKKDIKENTNFR